MSLRGGFVRRALTLWAAVSFLVLGVACTEDGGPFQGSWVAPAGSLRAMPGNPLGQEKAAIG